MEGWKEEIEIQEQGNTQLLIEVTVALNVDEPSRAEKVRWDREGVLSCLRVTLPICWLESPKSILVIIIETYGKLLKLPLTAQINNPGFSSQVTPWSDRPPMLAETYLFCIGQHSAPGSWEPRMQSNYASFLYSRASNSQNSSSAHEIDVL